MATGTQIASVSSLLDLNRPTTRCQRCHRVQFESASGICRVCGMLYACAEAVIAPPLPSPIVVWTVNQPASAPAPPAHWTERTLPSFWMPMALVIARHTNHLYQSEVARRLGCARTYVAKCEMGSVPLGRNNEKVADAYGVGMPKLVRMIEWLMEGK